MNQYHIYEKIGRGDHSTVYKGRRKKTVLYFAVQSVDKRQRPRVLRQVRALHALQPHPHALRFHAWYETTNHLWLILEYCAGGDLRAALEQDGGRVPEASAHDFCRDVASALRAAHCSGLLHCGLRPASVLIEEGGSLKLGGFGLSRRVSDVNKAAGGPAKDAAAAASDPPGPNLNRSAAPLYMAPELLVPGAPHSTASDLFSLGCLLHECAAGAPPFAAPTLRGVLERMLEWCCSGSGNSASPLPLPPGLSPELSHLLGRLLDPNPATRAGWAEVLAHPFWAAPPMTGAAVAAAVSGSAGGAAAATPAEPPTEPAFEAFVTRHGLSGGVAAAVAIMYASVDVERAVRAVRANVEALASAAEQEAREQAAAAAAEGGGGAGDAAANDGGGGADDNEDDEEDEDGSGRGGKGSGGGGGGGGSSNAPGAQAARRFRRLLTADGDVRLDPSDVELDFDDVLLPPLTRAELDAQAAAASARAAAAAAAATASTRRANGSGSGSGAAPATPSASRPPAAWPGAASSSSSSGGAGRPLVPTPPSDVQGMVRVVAAAGLQQKGKDGGGGGGGGGYVSPGLSSAERSPLPAPGAQASDFSPACPASSGAPPGSLTPPPQPQTSAAAGATAAAPHQRRPPRASSSSSTPSGLASVARGLAWIQAFDGAVRPIVGNRRIERLATAAATGCVAGAAPSASAAVAAGLAAGWDAAAIPFKPLTLEEVLDCDQRGLEAFLTRVYVALAGEAEGAVGGDGGSGSAAVASAAPRPGARAKANVLAYFESLCGDTAAANVLINSSLSALFVRMLRESNPGGDGHDDDHDDDPGASLLRARLASVLGMLVRHATFIADDLAATGAVGALADALIGDGCALVRRRAAATLGELLFYVATQTQTQTQGQGQQPEAFNAPTGGFGEGEEDDDDEEQHEGEDDERRAAATAARAAAATWGVGPATVSALAHALSRATEPDDVVRHYAAKAVENVAGQGGWWARLLAEADARVVPALAETAAAAQAAGTSAPLGALAADPSALAYMRTTACSCLARLLRGAPRATARRLAAGGGLAAVLSSLAAAAGAGEGSSATHPHHHDHQHHQASSTASKLQVAGLNVLNFWLLASPPYCRPGLSSSSAGGGAPALADLLLLPASPPPQTQRETNPCLSGDVLAARVAALVDHPLPGLRAKAAVALALLLGLPAAPNGGGGGWRWLAAAASPGSSGGNLAARLDRAARLAAAAAGGQQQQHQAAPDELALALARRRLAPAAAALAERAAAALHAACVSALGGGGNSNCLERGGALQDAVALPSWHLRALLALVSGSSELRAAVVGGGEAVAAAAPPGAAAAASAAPLLPTSLASVLGDAGAALAAVRGGGSAARPSSAAAAAAAALESVRGLARSVLEVLLCGGAAGAGAGGAAGAAAGAAGGGGGQLPPAALAWPLPLVNDLMPVLCSAAGDARESGDTRFHCLRLLAEALTAVLVVAAQPPQPPPSSSSTSPRAIRAAVDALVARHVLPLAPLLLRDEEEDPMPLYALKLLSVAVDPPPLSAAGGADASSGGGDSGGGVGGEQHACAVVDAGLAPTFFAFLALEHQHNNVHNARLCRSLVAARRGRGGSGGGGCSSGNGGAFALPLRELARLRAADRAAAVLGYAHANNVEPFLEPVVELCRALLARCGGGGGGGGGGRGGGGGIDEDDNDDPSSAAAIVEALLDQLPALADLATHPDASVAAGAARAVAALAGAARPRVLRWAATPAGRETLEAAAAAAAAGGADGGGGGGGEVAEVLRAAGLLSAAGGGAVG
jgi:hypothetical protein